ncbi:MAG: chemotaxis protein CheX [Spirochaetales bacterium]|nr:chemotaxis protein CheX [Spirochaetales bacterium]
MRVEYVNPFVDAAIQVLSSTVSEYVKREELVLRPKITPAMGVTVIVGLAGQISGRVIIDMSRETGLRIASAMNDEEIKEYDELAISTITELANMITGKAVTWLTELGFQFDITPPALFIGDNIQIANNQIEVLVVPIELPQCKLEISVGIKEK